MNFRLQKAYVLKGISSGLLLVLKPAFRTAYRRNIRIDPIHPGDEPLIHGLGKTFTFAICCLGHCAALSENVRLYGLERGKWNGWTDFGSAAKPIRGSESIGQPHFGLKPGGIMGS